MVSLEQSEGNIEKTEDVMNQQQINLIVRLLTNQKTHLEDKKELSSQIEKITHTSDVVQRVYQKKFRTHLCLANHMTIP